MAKWDAPRVTELGNAEVNFSLKCSPLRRKDACFLFLSVKVSFTHNFSKNIAEFSTIKTLKMF
jgi:hypothetical protein